MINLFWHLFALVWITGILPYGGYRVWNQLPSRKLDRELQAQAAHTRMAELRARESRALESAHPKHQIESGGQNV